MKLIIFLCAFSMATLWGQIVESFHLEELFEHVDTPETLIVFDIDNTLMETKQQLGSDQWFGYMMKSRLDQGMSETQALKEVLPLWTRIQLATEVKPCEASTAYVVRELQKEGYAVIGLTTRSVALAWRTIDQLETIGVHLHQTAPNAEDFRLSCHYDAHQDPAYYIRGILFSSGAHKGDILLDFLKTANYNPSKIIFINDKKKYLVDVEETLAKQGKIDYVGIRYGACDERVSQLDPQLCDLQLHCMGRLLTDDMAGALMNGMQAVQPLVPVQNN